MPEGKLMLTVIEAVEVGAMTTWNDSSSFLAQLMDSVEPVAAGGVVSVERTCAHVS